jgi:hypothetical protein
MVFSVNPYAFGQASFPVKIVSSSNYIDSIDYYHVVGEVENSSPSVIKYVQVIGTFYDGVNRVVGTSFTFTTPPDISPGSKAPFDLFLGSASIPIRQITNYSLQVSYQ